MIKSNAWILKAVALNLMSRLPLHEQAHFHLQRLLGKHRLDAPEMFRRALELFGLLRHAGVSVEGAAVLEIGTGWFPFVPVMAHLLGAAEVVTVDIHPWLKRRNLVRTIESLGGRLVALAETTRCDPAIVRERHQSMRLLARKARSLSEMLDALHIRYLKKCDITRGGLENDSMDVVLSSNVLEHVPPATLSRMHREIARLLREKGYAVHRFNPGDHFEGFTGSSIHFLRYGERSWRWLGGYGLSYHNRMRSCEHATCVRDSGLSLSLWADRVDEKATAQVREGRATLDPRFVGLPVESVCASYTWFVARKDASRSAPRPVLVDRVAEIFEKKPPAVVG